MYTFSKQTKRLKINVLKALAGTSWGQDRDTLTLTYKSTCRTALEYGVPILGPGLSDTNWKHQQTKQNQALRIATGCTLISHEDHLHQETKVLPFRPHSNLLTKQFLAASHLPGHPGTKHLGRPPAPRSHLRKTLLRHEQEVTPLFDNLPMDQPTYKTVIKSLHTSSVQEVIGSYIPNKLPPTRNQQIRSPPLPP